jgi:hypothetical protein
VPCAVPPLLALDGRMHVVHMQPSTQVCEPQIELLVGRTLFALRASMVSTSAYAQTRL